MVTAYARWRQAAREIRRAKSMIKTSKHGLQHAIPWVATEQRYLEIFLKYALQFGFTPSARTHLAVNGPAKKTDDDFFGDGKPTSENETKIGLQ
jgi:P27 family predicted phage terminase small subunit